MRSMVDARLALYIGEEVPSNIRATVVMISQFKLYIEVVEVRCILVCFLTKFYHIIHIYTTYIK